MKPIWVIGSGALSATIGSAQVLNPLYTSIQTTPVLTELVDISSLLDNKGFGESPGDADFDGNQGMEAVQL
jgi:hypothetical protein